MLRESVATESTVIRVLEEAGLPASSVFSFPR